MTTPTALPDGILQRIVSAVPGAVLIRTRDSTEYGPDDVVIFDGIVPKTPPTRYAIVYMDDGTLDALAACNESDSATVRWQITSVGPTRQMASWVASTIRFGTVDTKPTVPGWSCGQIKHVYGDRPSRDETVGEIPVVFKPDLYDLYATRV